MEEIEENEVKEQNDFVEDKSGEIVLGGRDKIKNWLKDYENLILIGVIIFALAIRWFYFSLTMTQPLWWDELAYGSLAKNFITHAWDGTSLIIGETLIRPLLFPYLWSILMRFGIGEVGVRFFLEFVPSILSVVFVYLVGKEVYSKRVGLIGAFIFSTLWIHLFYTGRLLTNVPALVFLFASVYYFIKSTKTGFVPTYFAISLILLSISSLIRYPNALVFFVFLCFLILTLRFNLVKNKKFWYSGIIGIAPMLLFFVYNLITSGHIFPALSGTGGAASSSVAYHVLNFIPTYLAPGVSTNFAYFSNLGLIMQSVFLIAFQIGLIVVLFGLFTGYDRISRKKDLQGHLILLLVFAAIFGYFIFMIRGAEDRWLFPASLSLVLFAGVGLDYLYRKVRKYNKQIAYVLLIIVLTLGAYGQINFADDLIRNKKESFLQIQQGFEWIKENTPPDSVILGQGIEVYSLYYSERFYARLPKTMEEVDDIEADYLVTHIFTGQPGYIQEYLIANQDKWVPVNVFFLDKEQTQPAFVIYQRV